MNRTWLFVILGVCATGLAGGFGVRELLFPRTRIAIYPSNVDFQDGRVQGQPLETHFELKNESRSSLTVTKLSSSCGCMVLSGTDGQVKAPFTLVAGATFPLTLNVTTDGRTGPQTFRLSATGEGAFGAPAEALATVRANLLAALRAEPGMVLFRHAKAGTEHLAEVKLADMLPDPGVRIREVKVSNDKTMRVELQPETGPSNMFGDSAQGHTRATLKLTYMPDATQGRIQEMITIVPEDDKFPIVQVPVYCEIAAPPYRFTPSGLTIAANAENNFRRTVAFDADEPATISLLKAPQGVTVEIDESSASRRLITITGDIAKFTEKADDVVFSINGEDISFPIRVATLD